MAITNFVWTESDRAVHEELNDTSFLLFDDVYLLITEHPALLMCSGKKKKEIIQVHYNN